MAFTKHLPNEKFQNWSGQLYLNNFYLGKINSKLILHGKIVISVILTSNTKY